MRLNETSKDIGLEVQATSVRSSPPQDVVVDLRITATRLQFKPTNEGRYAVSIAMGLYCVNPRNQLIGLVKGRLSATVNEATYREYLQSGIPYSVKLQANGDPYTVKVVASDAGSGLTARPTLECDRSKPPQCRRQPPPSGALSSRRRSHDDQWYDFYIFGSLSPRSSHRCSIQR